MSKKAKKRGKPHVYDCMTCGAACCRYVAVEIDKPTCKLDYDHIRWYLLHENVYVYVDHDGDWYVEFESPCGNLDKNQLCTGYKERPRICRAHGEGDEECVFICDGEEPHVLRFSSAKNLNPI